MNKKNKYGLLFFIIITSLIGCNREKPNQYPGYVQGSLTYISAYYSGIIKKIYVQPGDTVDKGQPLFSLESYPEHAEVQAANARVQQALDEQHKYDAHYTLQKANHIRNVALFKNKVISQEELDISNEALHSALANKKAAEANFLALNAQQKKVHWIVGQKTVNSPINATVFDTYYSEYEKVLEPRPVLSLLAPDAVKIIFFIPEPELARLQINQHLDVFVDGREQPVSARVLFISPKAEYTPPIIFSEVQRQMLVFRVEAQPLKQGKSFTLHPGQPVTVHLKPQNKLNSASHV